MNRALAVLFGTTLAVAPLASAPLLAAPSQGAYKPPLNAYGSRTSRETGPTSA